MTPAVIESPITMIRSSFCLWIAKAAGIVSAPADAKTDTRRAAAHTMQAAIRKENRADITRYVGKIAKKSSIYTPESATSAMIARHSLRASSSGTSLFFTNNLRQYARSEEHTSELQSRE